MANVGGGSGTSDIDTSHIEVTWTPRSGDAAKIDAWFHHLDKDGRGIVKGMDVAQFLKLTHLPRDVLKTIWGLIDKANLGYINKTQFNTIMRMVSIACSPIYMGSKPTFERLKATLYDDFPLPQTLTIPDDPAQTPAPTSTIAASGPTGAATPPALAPVQASYHASASSSGSSSPYPASPTPAGAAGGYPLGSPQAHSPLGAQSSQPGQHVFSFSAAGAAGAVVGAVVGGSVGSISGGYHYPAPTGHLPAVAPQTGSQQGFNSYYGQNHQQQQQPQYPAPIQNPHSMGAAPAPAVFEEEDEFSDFTAADGGQTEAATAATVPTVPSIPQSAIVAAPSAGMAAFDLLGSITDHAQCTAFNSAAGQSVNNNNDDDDDDFGPLTDASPVIAHSTGSASGSGPPAVVPLGVTPFDNIGNDDEDDEMGEFSDFTSAEPSTSIAQSASAAPAAVTCSGASTHASSSYLSNPPAVTTPPLPPPATAAPRVMEVPKASPWRAPAAAAEEDARMAAFDDLVQSDLQALEEDWDDFADANANPSAGVGAGVVSDAAAETASTAPTAATDSAPDAALRQGQSQGEDADPFGLSLLDEDPAPAAPAPAASPAAAPAAPVAVVAMGEEEEDFGDFGDFSHHSAGAEQDAKGTVPASVPDPSSSKSDSILSAPTVTAIKKVALPPLHPPASKTSVAEENGETEEEEFGDFGDFESHSPPPSAQSSSMAHSQHSKSDVNTPIDDPFDELHSSSDHGATLSSLGGTAGGADDAAQEPSAESEEGFGDFSPFAGAEARNDMGLGLSTQSEKASAAAFVESTDLLDFLSEPVITAGPAAGATTQIQQLSSFADDFLFDVTPPSSHADSGFGLQSGASGVTQVEESDTESARTVVPALHSAATSSSVGSLQALDSSDSGAGAETGVMGPLASRTESEDNASKKRKPFTVSELELLSLKLSEKRRYEDAYGATRQALLLRTMNEMLEQKQAALESDDLELAMKLKRDVHRLAAQLEGAAQEEAWEQAARTGRNGETLQETADLVACVDETLGDKFRRRYLGGTVPSDSAPIDMRMRFYIAARRSARLAVAISSTHPQHPQYWAQLLRCVLEQIKEATMVLANFRTLRSSDRSAVRSHPRMQAYGRALAAVAEVGLSVAASCLEAMVHEKRAGEIFSSCADILAQCHDLWGIDSKVRLGHIYCVSGVSVLICCCGCCGCCGCC